MSLGNLFLIFYFRNLACGTGMKNSIKRYIELLIQYSRAMSWRRCVSKFESVKSLGFLLTI